jgi:hypothetical protein
MSLRSDVFSDLSSAASSYNGYVSHLLGSSRLLIIHSPAEADKGLTLVKTPDAWAKEKLSRRR